MVKTYEIVANHNVAGRGRKLTIKLIESSDIQLEFHESGHPLQMNALLKLQFAHRDTEKLKQQLKAAGIEFKDYDYPWTWGVKATDPFGNELDFTRGYDGR